MVEISTSRAENSARHALTAYLQAENRESLWCFTDPQRRWLAEAFCAAGDELGLAPHMLVFSGRRYCSEDVHEARRILQALKETSLVLSVFSGESHDRLPYHRVLPNLRSPDSFAGTSGCIRQRYDDAALLQHLLTDPVSVQEVVNRYRGFDGKRVRLTAPGGTEITCRLTAGRVLPYEVGRGSRHAYLPPAEITFGMAAGSAEGVFVCDITAGEFAVRGKGVLDPMGLVDEPIRLTLRDGVVRDVAGGEMAARLTRHLNSVQQEVKRAVELGFGLSRGTPTGQIGPDESLQGTFHLGFGNDLFYGGDNDVPVHLDLVAAAPCISLQPCEQQQ